MRTLVVLVALVVGVVVAPVAADAHGTAVQAQVTNPTLRRGSTGEAVVRLQQLLAPRGFDPGTADGRFGPRTRQAVLAFQRANGLAADGIVGPITWRALLGAPAASPPPTSAATPVAPSDGTPANATWDALARCESGGRWNLNLGTGYYGGLQFRLASWQGAGGVGYPHEATREEQIVRAVVLWQRYGWKPWPGCTRKLGLA